VQPGGFTFKGEPYSTIKMLKEVQSKSEIGLDFYAICVDNLTEDFKEHLSELIEEDSMGRISYKSENYTYIEMLESFKAESGVGMHFFKSWLDEHYLTE